jgi:exopolysaccharide biosynthesis polyprenyl glycosylphosphotransferase
MTSITSEVPGEPELSAAPSGSFGSQLTPLDGIHLVLDDAVEPLTPRRPSPSDGVPSAKRQRRWQASSLRRHLVAGDVVALLVSWGGTLVIQTGTVHGQQGLRALVAVTVTLVAMHKAGLYRSRVCALPSLEAVRTLAAVALGTAAFVACDASVAHEPLAGPLEAGSAAFVGIFLLRWRFGRWLKDRRSESLFLRTVVLVGTNEDAQEIWRLVNDEPELGYRIGGVAGQVVPTAPWAHLPTCTDRTGIGDLARRAGANGVILVPSALPPGDLGRTIDQALAAGLHVQIWPGLSGLSSRRARLAPVSGVPLIYVEPRDVAPWKFAAKRAMDLTLAAVLFIPAAPLVAAAAVAIKLTDGGPVIFRSERVGRNGSTVVVLKLRTMTPNAAAMVLNVADLNERKGGPLFKASYDPRVTKVGRVLRSTSIDELPQLWNVFNGTMSLVGPRPALPHEVEHFDDELRRRHEMRPGITGLWQVEARDNPSFSAYRRLDLRYVDNWSLGLDVAILASTAHQIVVRAVKAVFELRSRPAPALPSRTAVSSGALPPPAANQLGSETA